MEQRIVEGLIRVGEMFRDGEICPHVVDQVVDCATQHKELTDLIFQRLAVMSQDSEAIRMGVELHMNLLQTVPDDESRAVVVEGALVMGMLFGMMIVFDTCKVEDPMLAMMVS